MKRILFVIVATLGLLVTAVPSQAPAAHAGVDDFTFASFDGQYYLDRDEDGRSTLRVVETLEAVFPETDQNRGIRRLVPERFDGHPTGLEIVSVTDEDGEPREFETESEDDFLEVTIAGDDYVHGRQSYVIEYTQRDVTRYFDDTDADEFYWDVNGTDWAQPFERVAATVHLGEGLEERLTGEVDAVWGDEGDENAAGIDGLSFEASELAPGQTLTFAIGFEPGTFTPRDGSFFAAPWPTLAAIGALGMLALTGVAAVLRARRLRDAPGRGIIVAEYLPPRDADLLLSSVIIGKTHQATAAQIIAFAVAGNIRVVEVEDKKGKPQYRLDYLHDEGIDADEREFLHALFGATLTPGEQRKLGTSDSKAVERLGKLFPRMRKDAVTNGFLRKYPTRPVVWLLLVALLAGGLGFVFSLGSLFDAYGGAWPGVTLAVTVLSAIALPFMVSRTPLEAKGVEVRDHMKGLREYIALAEADRLRYLQSPQGALREPIKTDDRAQLVKLGERLLPYAMLFGLEKQWAAELGRYYEESGTQPGWYSGSAPFNAAVFASSMSSVSTSTASAYSASSGGSSGGASAGGGGGGGGGGGV